jgi:hypothetical protein
VLQRTPADSRLPLAAQFHRSIPPPAELELCKVVEAGDFDRVRELLDGGVRVNCHDFEGNPPVQSRVSFHWFVLTGYP